MHHNYNPLIKPCISLTASLEFGGKKPSHFALKIWKCKQRNRRPLTHFRTKWERKVETLWSSVFSIWPHKHIPQLECEVSELTCCLKLSLFFCSLGHVINTIADQLRTKQRMWKCRGVHDGISFRIIILFSFQNLD